MRRFGMPFCALLAVTCLMLAGCPSKTEQPTGQKSDENGKTGAEQTQKSPIVEAAKTPVAKLVGTWEGAFELDEEAFAAMVTASMGEDAEPEAVAAAVEEALQEAAEGIEGMKITFTFNEDGSAMSTMAGAGPEPEEKKGTWEILDESGNTMKIKLTAEDEDEPLEPTLVFDDDDTFTMQMPMAMPGAKDPIFKRVK
ncbi:MAG TPA: hypothetical protein VMY42_24285 [Thermoguttaceae bacterium]|nr:hypothetical protein [Thermoguttaceae bacterium]